MTKKSLGRQQRDAEAKRANDAAKNMKCWDDLHQQYNHIRASIEVSSGVLANAVQDKSLFAFMPDKASCIAAITTVTSDLIAFNDELSAIQATHAAKHGAHQHEQELVHALEVGESYAAFQSRWQAVIMPNVHIITEQVGQAINKRATVPVLDEDKLKSELQDPSVVSDVVVKEAAPAAEEVQGRGLTSAIQHIDEAGYQEGVQAAAQPA